MLKYITLFTTIFSISIAFSQNAFSPIDTLVTEEGTILIYPNRTWAYEDEKDFDGIMNPDLHYVISTDSNYLYKSYWKNDVTITCNSNNVKTMKDTLWMCVLDSLHNNYSIPIDGRITSKFGIRHGRNHNGTDLDLETGDTVYAAFDGKIRFAKMHKGGFGNLIIARHYNGLETYYAHLSKLLVAPNQFVKAGDPIGLGGNTGRSTGSHLHFEVRFYDQPIDPELIFDFKQKEIRDENLLVHKAIFKNAKTYSSSSSRSSSTYTSGSKKYYKVRSGDTLGAIASRNRTTVSKLCSLNGMRSTDILHIGQSIRVR